VKVTVGEMIFPPNSDSGDHKHAALEIFYVVSVELEHVVNGKSEILKPGKAGYVKPPDLVRHKIGAAGEGGGDLGTWRRGQARKRDLPETAGTRFVVINCQWSSICPRRFFSIDRLKEGGHCSSCR